MKPVARRASMEGSGIREIMDLADRTANVLRLEAGEPDFSTPSHIIEAAAQAAASGYTKYTPNRGLLEVRESMVRKLSDQNGIQVIPEQVVITTGAVNALSQALMVLVDPGESVLIPDLSWPNFEMMVALNEGTAVRYPLLPDRGFEPDLNALDELASSSPKAKAVMINTPANPTGAVFDRRLIEAILEIAEKHDLYVVSDECYERIIFEGEHTSPGALDPAGRVISCFSVSKSYAMTGWRLGYTTATPELANLIAKIQEAVTSCATAVSQKAAQAALDGDQTCVAEMRDSYRKRRDVAVDLLEEAGLLISVPKGSFFTMVNTQSTGLDGYTFCKRLLTDKQVAVAPGETFGAAGRGMVRVSLASDIDVLREGVSRLVAAVEEWTQ
ncbi:MAG: pyridoxal phosphate-dependent aminotransferase [Acidimicrobiia bacterium]